MPKHGRTMGQDIMRGEWGGRLMPDLRKTEPGLTWVGGSRSHKDLDDTSRKILAASGSGTSIFDPTLCELLYRWFCPLGGTVLDPFAGGSVRGLVASCMGRSYTGIDLRAEQVSANNEQLNIAAGPPPIWICGDSVGAASLLPPNFEADFLISCPPYADLEVYSDDPRDLSTMDYHDFNRAHGAIIAAACGFLKQDSFAAWVVGDARGKDGCLYGIVGDTVSAFRNAGLKLYNEAVLVTAAGSLPIRAGAQFKASRKLGRTHQNVLVFVKGNPKKATAKLEILQ